MALQNWVFAGYITDAIKLGRLTVNVGTRYDHLDPLTDRYNRLANFLPSVPFPLTVPGLPNLMGTMVHPGQGGLPRGQTDSYWKAFGPRLGLAYRLGSQMTVRAGYGIFYPPLLPMTSANQVGLAGSSISTSWVASLDGVTPLNPISNPYPTGLLAPLTTPAQLLQLGQGIAVSQRTNIDNFNMQQWNLSWQWQPVGNWLFQVAYEGSKGTHLPVPLNFNQLNPVYQALGATALSQQVTNPFYGMVSTGTLSTATVARNQLLAPYPQYTSVSMNGGENNQNEGNSIYNALEVTLQHHFSKGVLLSVAYTNSKEISDVSGRVYNYTAGTPPVQNIYNLKAERAVDEADVSQRLAISHVLELPVGRGRRFLGNGSGVLNEIVGGWSADGAFTFNKGFPLPLTSSGNSCVNTAVLLPNATGQSPVLSGSVESRLSKYFNTAAFSIPATCTFGNASRTVPNLRGPSRWNDNLALVKVFPIKESISLMFRAEAYNLTNTPYFGLPGLALGSSSFGIISSTTGTPREIQFALKVLF